MLRKHIFFGLLALVLLACPLASAYANGDSCAVSLEGTHFFGGGDNPEWKLPDFDDSAWAPVTVPGSWQFQAVKPVKGMGWYRIRFSVPEDYGLIRPALMLGRVGNSDEVFLNGEKIGGEGEFGDRFIECSHRQRLYPLPEGLLRNSGENLLAVRVMNTYRHGGILEGPVRIGELGDLVPGKYEREFNRKVFEAGLFVFFLFSILGSLFLFLTDVRETEYLAFAAFITLCGLIFLFDSLIFYETGLKTSLVQRMIHASTAFIPAAGLFFLLSLYGIPVRAWSGGIMALYGFLGLGLLVSVNLDIDFILVRVWEYLTPAVMGVCLYLAVSARLKKLHESGPVLAGIFGLVAAGSIEILDDLYPRFFQGIPAGEYGFGFFLVCIACALMLRYSRIRREVHLLSGRILDAHEEERKRLSREIHDGIGQALFAVKLHLQMLNAKVRSGTPLMEEAFTEIITEVTNSIGEVRQVAMDLRPAVLEHSSIVSAFKWYGKKFSEQSGIGLEVEGDDTLDVSLKTKDHLYRIFQEALNNIRRHAAAGRVEVRVERNGNFLSLRITDNGKGFDTHAIDESHGLGLSTMRERVELLGGTFTLRSAPGKGTFFHIEAPL